MALRIYNTMTRQKEEFVPIHPPKVGMYVCGVTVYDRCHIGHARSQVVFDTVARYLRRKGFELTYARNFTDIDDKIIKRAAEQGRSCEEVAATNIREFYTDMDALGIKRPELEPKATEHVGQIIDTVKLLVDKGYAYAKGGDVFYSTRKFKDYGKLSKRNLDDMIAGERVEIDERKKDPMDFVLWKAAKPGEPSWESPWGKGRPGWHIECSAMSVNYLGMPFDIHGGGKDLVFPHHENEIAQSEAAYGKEYVRTWMHNGFVQINQEKMAKSTGNFATIRDILQCYSPEALRGFLLSAHYRSPIEFSEQSLIDSEAAMERLYAAYELLSAEDAGEAASDAAKMNEKQRERLESVRKASAEFYEAMDDDFNTAKATGHLFEIAGAALALAGDKTLAAQPGRGLLLAEIKKEFFAINDILGILISAPKDYQNARIERSLLTRSLNRDAIEALIEKRTQARAAKDFAASDAIRDELAAMGVSIKDSPKGTTWTVK